ncbi:hypothetical protein H6G27_26510 [Nostoc linckia FACHB-104]|nr:hypothetical protein [Nostoc linckia FACHB-104]
MSKTKAGTSKSSQLTPLSEQAKLELVYRLQHTGVAYHNGLPILTNAEAVREYCGWLCWCLLWGEMDCACAIIHVGEITQVLETNETQVPEQLRQMQEHLQKL